MGRRARGAWPLLLLLLLILAAVRCVAPAPARLIPGPYGGVDAVFQAGLLAWSARWWLHPAVWSVAPVFYPATDALWAMDTLLGQGVLVSPLVALGATPAQLYDAALLLSLLLAAWAMARLWRTAGGGGPAAASGGVVAALALLAAPYTASQLGHLNQLPPFLPLLAAALLAEGLTRRRPRRVAAGLLAWGLQPLFGWYGVVQGGLLLAGVAWGGRRGWRRTVADGGWRWVAVGLLLAVGLLALQAQPYRRAARSDPGLHPTSARELRWYSADLQDLPRLGPYHARPTDWLGRGTADPERSAGAVRRVVHPGWSVLLLGLLGVARRRRLSPARQGLGSGLLWAGLAGLVFAFGDSVGLPGTGWRLPLPWGWLRSLAPPLQGYRAVCRFAWPLAVALAWWCGVAWRDLLMRGRGGRLAAALAALLLFLEGVPMGVPAVSLPAFPVRATTAPDRTRPLLSLPAPRREEEVDRGEAAWWLAALRLGRPVTGGASGRVPEAGRRWRELVSDPAVDLARVRAAMARHGITAAVTAAAPPASPGRSAWEARLRGAGWSRRREAAWWIWTPPPGTPASPDPAAAGSGRRGGG